MLKVAKINKSVALAIVLFLGLSAWWIELTVTHNNGGHNQANVFDALYGAMALYGGVLGLRASRKWGGAKSLLGRAILFLSLGLLAQEFGQIAYTYLGLQMPADQFPYPSIGDIGYFGSIPLYILGAYYMMRASGSSITLKSIENKIQAIILPLALLGGSYFVFLRGYQFDWHHPLTIFLDFGYPLGQTIYLAIALLAFTLSRKLLGGIMRPRILLILFALLTQYAADFNFLFQNSHNTYITAGYADYIYLVAYFLMSISLIRISHPFESPSPKKEEQA